MSSLLTPVERPVGPGELHTSPGLSFAGRVVEGWEALLERYTWDWFATFTFAEQVHPERADKLYRVWCSNLNRHVTGAKNWQRHRAAAVRWARGLEWQKRGVLHYHALMYQRDNLNLVARRLDWMDEWERLTGAFSRILPCDNATQVRQYIAKYCGKGGEVDIDPRLPRVAPGQRVARI